MAQNNLHIVHGSYEFCCHVRIVSDGDLAVTTGFLYVLVRSLYSRTADLIVAA